MMIAALDISPDRLVTRLRVHGLVPYTEGTRMPVGFRADHIGDFARTIGVVAAEESGMERWIELDPPVPLPPPGSGDVYTAVFE
jgi:hypothetical protein